MSDPIKVVSEPRTYHARSEESYFYDVAALAAGPGHSAFSGAHARLHRHATEVEAEIRANTVEGRAAARALSEVQRRAVSTAASSDGVFVTPQYLTDLYATFRSAHRSFVDQCRALPLPAVGVTFNLPYFNTASAASPQAGENHGTPTSAPNSALRTVALQTEAGSVTLSQQLLDRGGFSGSGGGMDQIVIKQMTEQMDASVDLYVLNQAIVNAGTVTQSGTLTVPVFYTNLGKGRALLTDTAGTRLLGTHVFTSNDLAAWLMSRVDDDHRPIMTPDVGSLIEVRNDPTFTGWLGAVLPGNLKWFADDNIPVVATKTKVLVARPEEILVWEGDPISFAYPETHATSLSVVVGLRKYVAALPRYPKAIASISGAAYKSTLS